MDLELTTEGRTLSLPGPETITSGDFLNLVRSFTLRPKSMFETSVPKPILSTVASLTNRFIWWPTMDADRVERMFIDDRSDQLIRKGKEGLSAKESWELAGVTPEKMEDHAIKFVCALSFPVSFRTDLDLSFSHQVPEDVPFPVRLRLSFVVVFSLPSR